MNEKESPQVASLDDLLIAIGANDKSVEDIKTDALEDYLRGLK